MFNKIFQSTKFKRYNRKFKIFWAKYCINNSNFLPGKIERIYHYHIRKSAGTSINTAFWNLVGHDLDSVGREPIMIGEGKSFVVNNNILIDAGNYFYASSHFPLWQLELPKNTFTFTVLRDPYKRLVSLYKYYKWVEQVTDEEEAFRLDPSYFVLKQQHYLLNKSFSEFLDVLGNKYLFGNLYMFSEKLNPTEGLENLQKLDKVYFQDNLDFAVEDLSNTLNLKDLKLPNPQRKFENSNFVISEFEKKKALQLLQPEIEFYNLAREKFLIPNRNA